VSTAAAIRVNPVKTAPRPRIARRGLARTSHRADDPDPHAAAVVSHRQRCDPYGRCGDVVARRNMIENAIRHSPKNGTVEIVSELRDRWLEIAVCDAGPGVPGADRERILEPFFRGAADRATDTPGAGLGLAIAREIARAHGGDVRLVDGSDLRRGARFVAQLPRVTDSLVK
jgi:signal transduction histidine kinase